MIQYLRITIKIVVSPQISDELSTIIQGLKQILSDLGRKGSTYTFFLYGSRANGKARKFSDYDIGITGGEDPVTFYVSHIGKSY